MPKCYIIATMHKLHHTINFVKKRKNTAIFLYSMYAKATFLSQRQQLLFMYKFINHNIIVRCIF